MGSNPHIYNRPEARQFPIADDYDRQKFPISPLPAGSINGRGFELRYGYATKF